jgi:hypothetical protein
MIMQRYRNNYVTTSDVLTHARDGSILCIQNLTCIRDPAYVRDLACIRDPASIETFDLDPQWILEAWIVYETRLCIRGFTVFIFMNTAYLEFSGLNSSAYGDVVPSRCESWCNPVGRYLQCSSYLYIGPHLEGTASSYASQIWAAKY